MSLTPASGTGDPVPNKQSAEAEGAQKSSVRLKWTSIHTAQPGTLKRVLHGYHVTDPNNNNGLRTAELVGGVLAEQLEQGSHGSCLSWGRRQAMKGDHRAIRVLQFHGEESYGRSVNKAPRQQSWLVNLPNQSRAGGQVIYDARWFHLHKGRRETHTETGRAGTTVITQRRPPGAQHLQELEFCEW